MPPAAVQNEHLYTRLAPSVRKVVSARLRERHRRHSASYELAADAPSYHHDWIGHSFASRVIDMLGRLPSRDHTVLWQYWFEPLTRHQMAALANCSPSKMARRIRRARARFDVLARRDPYVSRLLRDR